MPPTSGTAAAPPASSAPRVTEPDLTGPPRFAEPGLTRVVAAGAAFDAKPKAIVCEGRQPCRVLEITDAGVDEQRRRMQVLKVSLSATSREPSDPARITEGCEPIEYWLLTRGAKGIVAAERLLELCNDGYGAAGIGEDLVEIRENRFAHSRDGGSAWRWSEGQVLQLSPRRIVEVSSTGFWTLGPNRSSQSWSWETFSGAQQSTVPECDAEGRPPENWDPDAAAGSWVPIPVVDVDAEFAAEQWKTAHLGACAASVATEASAGYVVHGKHGGPEDSTLRVVGLSDRSFVVEITDDRFVLAAPRPLHEDHLEIWSGDVAVGNYMEHCEPKPTAKPVQWGVRLADGAVFDGFGAPGGDRVHAEIGDRDGGVRLKVSLRDPGVQVTFVYSDSDDGVSQTSLIATSRLEFGKARSLGYTLRIDPKNADCRLRAGRLEPRLK